MKHANLSCSVSEPVPPGWEAPVITLPSVSSLNTVLPTPSQEGATCLMTHLTAVFKPQSSVNT